MKLPEPMSWNRAEAGRGKFDGKFIIGVMTTGIYCLPSCAARPPKPQNVRLFTTEAEAKTAGLRACKRCRPDLYYRGEDENISLFEGLMARVRAEPGNFADASALAKGAGFESESVFHRQFLALTRMTPGAYRALSNVFLLQLPAGYRAKEVLAYHARDPESLCERSDGNRIWKALS